MKRISVTKIEGQIERSISLFSKTRTLVKRSRAILERRIRKGEVLYGVNTGFGALANTRIKPADIETLQENFLFSHAVGVGPAIPKEITKLMLGLKIYSLGLGHSAISEKTFLQLIKLYRKDLIPVVPSKGSLGASGDLAPLAHLALPLIGHGEVWDKKGEKKISAARALKNSRIERIRLQAKDGLSLCNGTQMMSAYGAHVLSRVPSLLKCADLAAAMSIEAIHGRTSPFNAKIHKVRPYKGQLDVAANIRKLLSGSEILKRASNESNVQDPYSLRCVPQVHGAARDALAYCIGILEIEINSATDNPLIFSDGAILSGGNFHGEPLALAFDFAAMALSEIASISERRNYLLLSGRAELPTFLVKEGGLNSGFMIPQYTAASLVSENKVLSHPASVDSITSSLGQEDHVSMGSISALKLFEIFKNVEFVLALELLVAAQALDFRRPNKSSRLIEIAHRLIRRKVSHRRGDSLMTKDLNAMHHLVENGELISKIESAGGRFK